MVTMPMARLLDVVRELADTGPQGKVLWQEGESLAFVAKGRDYRSEFHVNPSDEVMFQIRGTMRLHYRMPDGREDVAVLPEGAVIHTPAGTPHSPRFPSDAFVLVIERRRRPGEIDRFRWHCPGCDHLLHEESFVVDDYRADPVSAAYRSFYDREDARTCKRCGTVLPLPEQLRQR